MASQKTVKGCLCNDRGNWTVRARVFNPKTGETSTRTKTTGYKVKDNTKRRAQEAMKEIVAQWEAEVNSVPIKRAPLFREYVEAWLKKKETTKRANTALSYRHYTELHILPEFGNYRVRDITRPMLQEYCNRKLEALSVNSVKKHFIVIRGALHDAAIDDVIVANPAENVEFPRAEKFEGKAYTPEQVAVLLDMAKREGEPMRAAITLAVVYGLRRSEICGLRWCDIDFSEGKLCICHTKTQNGTLVIEADQTKTAKSRRTINLIGGTISYLKELKQTQKENGLILDKVCVWPDGRAVRPDFLTRRTGQLMKKCRLEKIRLHDLRHTAATLLSTKATPKQVQEFLGHSDISITMGIYAHLLEDDRKETSNIMDNILKSSVFCSEKCSENGKEVVIEVGEVS